MADTGGVAEVRGLDHIVLNVADAERSMRWYCDRLGLESVRYEEWKTGEAPFVSVRIDEGTIIDLFEIGPKRREPERTSPCGSSGDVESIVAHPDMEVVSRARAAVRGPRLGLVGVRPRS